MTCDPAAIKAFADVLPSLAVIGLFALIIWRAS